jgi:hypothetical protein
LVAVIAREGEEEMYRFGSAVIAALFFFAGSALATVSGPKTTTRTLNVTGVGASGSPVNALTGACNIDPWVDQCSVPTGSTCTCVEITMPKASGNMDKGNQTVTNFFVTEDPNVNPATEPAVGSGPNPKCSPFRAILTDTSSAEAKTLNLIGVSCKKVIAISNTNPSGTHVSDTIVGGWGISNSTIPSPDASGWGTVSGSVTKSTSAISIKITGQVTE